MAVSGRIHRHFRICHSLRLAEETIFRGRPYRSTRMGGLPADGQSIGQFSFRGDTDCHSIGLHPFQICRGITQMSEHSVRALRNLPACAGSRRVLVYLLSDFQPIPPVGNDRFYGHEGSTRHSTWHRLRHGTASENVLRQQETSLTGLKRTSLPHRETPLSSLLENLAGAG